MHRSDSLRQTRRRFLGTVAAGAVGLTIGGAASRLCLADDAESLVDDRHIFRVKEAMYYEKLEKQRIKCVLCPRECTVADRERGFCGNRENRGGTYYTLAHGNPCAANPDPIEKKPFAHFLPGTTAFSISTAGCNFVCKYCQNWQISQERPEQTRNVDMPPERVCRLTEQALDEAGRGRGLRLLGISACASSSACDFDQARPHVDAVRDSGREDGFVTT